MPTPESELFLRQKPKVPPTFQGVDFQDNEAVADARDAIVREQWVQRMMKRLVGEEMGMSVENAFCTIIYGTFLRKEGSESSPMAVLRISHGSLKEHGTTSPEMPPCPACSLIAPF
ncbi:hypothetical protein FOPE_00183 [Fonsecaea pedrosoi]|nr:hypothetical protein FOPE_00183 [Fonsecaea pedrosoi]